MKTMPSAPIGAGRPAAPAPTAMPAVAARPASRPAPRPWSRTVTAALVAARLEQDGSIQLRVADPARPRRTLRVVMPDPAAAADRALGDRLRAARAALVETVGQPPFEGFMLLYGEARLTLAGPDRPGQGAMPRVLDFVALDAAPPAWPCAAARTRSPRRHPVEPDAA